MTDSELHELAVSLEHSVWKAVVERDGNALRKLFADDYIEITLDGKRIEKQTVVNESPAVDQIDRYMIDSEKTVVVSQSCVILSYHLTIQGISRGITISPTERWATSVWSERHSSWQCQLFQQSPYPAHQ